MLNFLTKKTPLLVASLLATTIGFAQDHSRAQKKGFDQGLDMPMSQTLPAHSYPARKEVLDSWDVNGTMSYILWQAIQENMDVALVSNTENPIDSGSIISIKHTDVGFKSGFKAGLGLNLDYDRWNVYSEYTWFHGTTRTVVPSASDQFVFLAAPTIEACTEANQSWNLKMDLVDLSLSRSYYSGTKLTFQPFFGVRGAWIRQSLNTNYARTEPLAINANTVSQGVGPRTGLDSNWLLGYGLRLTGKASGDILYTRYHSTQQHTTTISPTKVDSFQFRDEHNGLLRAHTDLELGLGWGSYFDNNKWYVDISAEYGFQVFWNQNMMRTNGMIFAPNSNLFVHGLNIAARLDF